MCIWNNRFLKEGERRLTDVTESNWMDAASLTVKESRKEYLAPDGCIPASESEWMELQASWIGKELERFYAFLQRKCDGVFVGDVNYHYNPKKNWCDMGIVVYAPERGKGYGSQGLRLLLDRAFKTDGFPACIMILKRTGMLHITSTKRLVFGKQV